MDDLVILLSANLNKGKSIGDINKSIKEIQKSGLLKDLKLNVDIDQGFKKAIKEFTKSANQLNKIIEAQNRVVSTETSIIKDAEGAVVNVTRKRLANGEIITETTKKIEKSVNAHEKEAQAISRLNKELETNDKLRTRIKSTPDNSEITTNETIGNKFNQTTTSYVDRLNPDTGQYERAQLPTVQAIDHKGFEEARKSLEEFKESAKKRISEVNKTLGNFNEETVKVRNNLNSLNELSSKKDFLNVDKQIKSLEETAKKTNEIRFIQEQNATRAQQRFLKLDEERQKKIIDRAHREAKNQNDLANQMAEYRIKSEERVQKEARQWNEIQQRFIQQNADLKRNEELKLQQAIEQIEKKRIKDIDAAEYAAYKEKEKREKNLHGNRVQDQKVAYDLAIIEDDKFNKKRMDNLHKQALVENKQFDDRIRKEQEFLRKQQDSLNKLAIAQQKFGHHTKVAANLKDVESQIKAITLANKDWDNSFKNIDTHIKKSTAGFKAMRQESVGFIEGFSTAMVKFCPLVQ
jgi:hypothetical protein